VYGPLLGHVLVTVGNQAIGDPAAGVGVTLRNIQYRSQQVKTNKCDPPTNTVL
jgi:5-hydroxyisourate hydrolase-like protein (transthyretin family)